MPWKKANKGLIDLLEKQMLNCQCERRVMFGSPTFFVRGNMFAGVHEDTIIIRLSQPDLKEIFTKLTDVRPFTPMGNRPMKEYAAMPQNVASQQDVLKHWLDRSYEYASSLPAKDNKGSAKQK